MKPKNFSKYVVKNPISFVGATEYSLQFFFENGKKIMVCFSDDKIEYDWVRKPKRNANKKLMEDMLLHTPDYLKKMIDKYGQQSPTIELFNKATKNLY